MNYITAKKLNMSQIFIKDDVVPVTLVKIEDSVQDTNFEVGKILKITGVSKGKGFQGVVKRYGFRGGPKTHGQKNRLRAPGSIGDTASQRVWPGRKMAGRTGSETITLKKKIIEWDDKNRILALKGPLPGARGVKIKIFI
ncbi:MAG: 50S ribosomal protein L3 [Candidatus Liptonbacteria bacterium]|nr:50S ribosomal protein L3 [Candidatus Liptonbacteria bacterium]